ncbi:penicillin-binding protein 1B [Saccharospirillum impatiens]|uniref:penicillin-binding protein 1B n=1 Tax=Saccharospirillum impatiens TaxID=169438 RepID=UPI000409B84F|nr:penicillin-binding protein 1B [Saccharospirillum impatiens]
MAKKPTRSRAGTTRRAAPKSRSSRRSKARKQSRGALWRWRLFQLSTIGAAVLIAWMFYLNAVVRERFEGQRFTVPARVYSEAQELYAGAPVSADQVESLLQALGYRQTGQLGQSGRYLRRGQTLSVHTRGFDFWDNPEPARRLELDFSQGSLVNMVTPAGQSVMVARLDPLYIGQIYPGSGEDRLLLPLTEVPASLLEGLIAVEDRRFFQHWGISPVGIARALWANVSSGSIAQGGSTLTQQLVKNMFLTADQTLWRKGNEALMALLMEWHYSKEEILEAYVNEIYIGQQGRRSINGFGLGAQFFFGSPLRSLNIHQQALLVGLIKGPSYYNPRRNPEQAMTRRNVVLSVWRDAGVITQAEYDRAVAAGLDISNVPGDASYPTFMDLVRRQLDQGYRRQDLLAEGLTVFTTLDPLAQNHLEKVLPQGLAELERNHSLADNTLEGAAVVTRPSTGDVLAITGGRRPELAGFNRALDARRQVGSLMKPAVYLAALEAGYTLATPISDAPVQVASADGDLWEPKNYDKESHGTPILLDAFANSYNQATARLGMEVGLPEVFGVIDRLGVDERLPRVPSVMLGAVDLSPFHIAQMYQTIAGNGFYSPLNAIRAVVHPDNGVLQRFDLRVEQRFAPEQMYLVQEALHRVTLEGTARSLQWRLPGSWWLAGKTGTTDDSRDAWFAGYSSDRQAVVWVGRDGNEPTPLTGSTGALPIWADIMAGLNPNQERRGQPAAVVRVPVNAGGAQVSVRCDGARELPFITGSEPPQRRGCDAQPGTTDSEDGGGWWQRLFN